MPSTTDLKARVSGFFLRLKQKRRQAALDKEASRVKEELSKKEMTAASGAAEKKEGAIPFLKNLFGKKKETGKLEEPKKKIKENVKPEEHKKKIKEKRRARLKFHLDLAGLEKDPQRIIKELLIGACCLDLTAFIYISYKIFQGSGAGIIYFLSLFFLFATVGFIASAFIVWAAFYAYIDVRVYKRKIEIEKVLPDFLQLASANIKSGMPIDKALWLAVRPRFGVLAKEIEIVAKQTMTGSDLEEALKQFADKYDSMTLKRSISLIIEGLRSGGEIGDLLYRISSDIQDSEILKKEMAASLTTYVIFISFATVLAAPFLFGLASQLLSIVQEVTGNIDMPDTGSGGMGISVSSSGIDQGDFRIFAITMLSVTSFFSALIIATIQKGDIKAGLKYIPIFVITTVVLFHISAWGLGKIFEGMF